MHACLVEGRLVQKLGGGKSKEGIVNEQPRVT